MTKHRELQHGPLTQRQVIGQRQSGTSLIELLVGLSIGMLTTSAALATLWMLQSFNYTISELAHLQQQAAYAFRVLGQQIRQAGDYALKPSKDVLAVAALDSLDGQIAVYGEVLANTHTLTIRLPNSIESIYKNANSFEAKALSRNCLQESGAATISSSFKLHNNQLVCAGTGQAQAIISDVSDFQVRYLVRHVQGGAARFQYFSANAMTAEQWKNVQAVEICLGLTGQIAIDTAGATYVRCDGSEVNRANRLQLVLRSQYSIRSRL